ncbi:hypothetical protein ACFP7A_01010 [Sporolactobacillus kofuensis]|uniref:Uncharacterized protein n=1 Tax=Sporolactobacillus kofuensis TaxID=269672 RepID=A0ABW1WBU8_9BACL|nr:hypothetical protein [Sporolactobacillus kofuensis]MCO7175519.1 hypothetical protein [Sporolactobacillus kofuensis]
MNNQQSLLMSAIQSNYRFKQINRVNEQPFLIETERGLKKIRIWDNEAMLKLHLKWREQLVTDRFFIDRMYVTRSGLPFVRVGHYAVTCHDAPYEVAPIAGHEGLWADLITHLMMRSRSTPVTEEHFSMASHVQNVFEQAKTFQVMDHEEWKLIHSCFSSVFTRAEKADHLRESNKHQMKTFLLPEDFSSHSCTQLFDTLFCELGQSQPMDGYRLLADLLLREALEHEEQSVHHLLQHLSRNDAIDQRSADLMLAQWFEPTEWVQFVYSTVQKDQGIRTDITVQKFKHVWDQKVRLIHEFSTLFLQTGASVGGT